MQLRERVPGVFGGRDPRGWYDIDQLDDRTYAIHERRYWQRNVNYLIIGSDRAIVFDTGSGLSNLAAVVSNLTDVPVTALASHVHWDHVGCHPQFGHVAAADLPIVRQHTSTETFRSTFRSTLTLRARRFGVSEWIHPGSSLELGGRSLSVFAAPGHTPDSIALYDSERGQLFSGDFLYDGPIAFGMLPGSSLVTSADSARNLVATCDVDVVYGGHYGYLDGSRLAAFANALTELEASNLDGPGRFFRTFEVEDFSIRLTARECRRVHASRPGIA